MRKGNAAVSVAIIEPTEDVDLESTLGAESLRCRVRFSGKDCLRPAAYWANVVCALGCRMRAPICRLHLFYMRANNWKFLGGFLICDPGHAERAELRLVDAIPL